MTANLDEAKEIVLKKAKEQNVRFIRMWFTDILGFLKSYTITIHELEGALTRGTGIDGSSIEGFTRIDESDMIAMPDPSTFQVLPWRHHEEGATARLICDIVWPGGKSFEGDPRYVLKRNLKKAADLGFIYYVAPELEYFYFRSSAAPEFIDKGGYFDHVPPETASDLRRETVIYLEEMGIDVEKSHHEVAESQHEIDLRYTDALTMADNVQTYRSVVKQVAQMHGYHATFMPKPIYGINGSGMHVHMSLFKGKKNSFFEKDDKYHLSKTAKSFIAGVLAHIREITAVNNQWVNSYKRLVPGYEAPVYVSWARRNRADLIRVPEYQPGHEEATRFEVRSPDPACNPYLCFSVLLAAGLDGIKKGMEPPPPVEENVYEMSADERKRRGINTVPGSLFEAIEIAEKSDLVKEALGEHTFNSFIENKKIEWDRYRTYVTDYEIKNYLPLI
jgi:glutamine synthetase